MKVTRLAGLDAADIGLVDIGVDVDLAQVLRDREERRRGERGGDRLAEIDLRACTTTPSTGDRMSVRARSISMSLSLASRCSDQRLAGRDLRLGSSMSASRPAISALDEAICASAEASVAVWISTCVLAVIEGVLRADVALEELVLPLDIALHLGELCRRAVALGAEVAQRGVGAVARRLGLVELGALLRSSARRWARSAAAASRRVLIWSE